MFKISTRWAFRHCRVVWSWARRVRVLRLLTASIGQGQCQRWVVIPDIYMVPDNGTGLVPDAQTIPR